MDNKENELIDNNFKTIIEAYVSLNNFDFDKTINLLEESYNFLDSKIEKIDKQSNTYEVLSKNREIIPINLIKNYQNYNYNENYIKDFYNNLNGDFSEYKKRMFNNMYQKRDKWTKQETEKLKEGISNNIKSKLIRYG